MRLILGLMALVISQASFAAPAKGSVYLPYRTYTFKCAKDDKSLELYFDVSKAKLGPYKVVVNGAEHAGGFRMTFEDSFTRYELASGTVFTISKDDDKDQFEKPMIIQGQGLVMQCKLKKNWRVDWFD